jgi:hypothetical protein
MRSLARNYRALLLIAITVLLIIISHIGFYGFSPLHMAPNEHSVYLLTSSAHTMAQCSQLRSW